MNCIRYKEMLNKWAEQDLTLSEINELSIHCEKCEECKQEYLELLKYKDITNKLKHLEPVIMNKELFIDEIMNKLPDHITRSQSGKLLTLPTTFSKIRLAITSVAAALVLFFITQQTMDAWKIKQLEARIYRIENTQDYSSIKNKYLFRILEQKIYNRLIYRLLVIDNTNFYYSTITKLNYQNSYAILRLNKISDSDFSFLLDSNEHLLKLMNYENK